MMTYKEDKTKPLETRDDSTDRILFQIMMQDPHFREEIEQLYQERTQKQEENKDGH